MSKNIYRQLNIKFWSDVWVVEKLNALDRYLFIYLLTNDKANDAGIYEISKRMISFETGITVDELDNMWERLEQKVTYIDGYVVFKNGINNKNYNYNTFKGISTLLENLPVGVYEKVMNFVYIQQDLLDSIKKDLDRLKGLQGAYKGIPHNRTKQNKTEQNINTPKKSTKKIINKNKYGEFENVLLSDEELNKLINKIGDSNTNIFIDRLDGYVESTGKKYKSHYATILNWVKREITTTIKKTNEAKINLSAVGL
ncbi:MAG: hypothetical protein ACTSQE_14875 [Candidatus Heimdallarchaeaceae archaeon]